MRVNTVLCGSLALALYACASERGTTEPSSGPNPSLATAEAHTAATPTLAAHPSKNLDPEGRTVRVIAKGFPANVTVQLAECTTGFPLDCQVLSFARTNAHGMLNTRVLVALDLTVINPFPHIPTCGTPTPTGAECQLSATETESPFVSAFTPIRFSPE